MKRLWMTLPLLFVLASATAAAPVQPAATQVAQQLKTYYFDAARIGNTAMLQEFSAAGYDLNTRDEKGYTALILAAYHGQAQAVALLLKAGADPCAQDNRGNTALMGAIFKGEVLIARRLLAAGCQPNQRNNAGQTAAMYAALFQRAEILQTLKARGADMQATDRAGNTPTALVRGEFATP